MSLKKLRNLIYNYWQKDKPQILFFIAILIIAAFFRLYRLEEFITFLGDQGRDAIIIKKIITAEHFPGIGPRSSIGSLFLGPFYYYLMAPFLFLFNFNPLGLAFGVAFISIICLPYLFWIVRKETNYSIAITFILLITFSYINIWLSRFSWNPNLLPIFSFLTIYFGSEMIKRKGYVFPFLFGAFLAASIQLHYLGLLIIPAILVIIILQMAENKKHLALHLVKIVSSGVGFCIVLAPLILFDLKNNFLNVRGIIALFSNKKGIDSNAGYIDQLRNTSLNLLHHVFNVPVPGWAGTTFIIACVIATVILFYKRKTISSFVLANALTLTSFLFLFAIMNSERHPHYYTPVYYCFFFIVAFLINQIRPVIAKITVIALFIAIYCWLNIPLYTFWQKEGNFQTHIAADIADNIIAAGTKSPFYLVSVPLANTNDHIRYYLELKGHRPLPEDTTEMAQELVILCYDKSPKGCDVMNEPQYLVVHFGDRTIAKVVRHKEVTIYRLIHAK